MRITRKFLVLAVVIFIAAGNLWSAEDGNDPNKAGFASWSKEGTDWSSMDEQGNIAGKLISAIIMVAVLGVGAYFLTKKLGPKINTISGKNIKIKETMSLGGQKRLYLVEVEGRKILIGSTNENIGLIKDLGQDEL